MNILDFYTEPSHDPCATNNRVFNFMRPHFSMPEKRGWNQPYHLGLPLRPGQ